MAARTAGSASVHSGGGNGRGAGGGAADDPQDAGEADPVGVEVGGLSGSADEHADRVVDDQPGPDLLVDQVGQPGAQDPAWSAEVGLELVVRGLLLPALVVGGGQFVGAGGGRVGDRGQQHDQLAGAAPVPVGHVVLDHPDQLRVVGVEFRSGAGRGEDPFPAGAADRRVDQDGQVGAV